MDAHALQYLRPSAHGSLVVNGSRGGESEREAELKIPAASVRGWPVGSDVKEYEIRQTLLLFPFCSKCFLTFLPCNLNRICIYE